MNATCEVWDALATLLDYPRRPVAAELELVRGELAHEAPDAVRSLDLFAQGLDGLSPEEREELYTRTFDINPLCSLEVGWQIYGETYDRGGFLVKLKAMMRECGVEEGTELPDHLIHMLPLAGRLPHDASRSMCRGLLIPAIEKMLKGFPQAENPYAHLLDAVLRFITVRGGADNKGGETV